jgi:hypothetical protein
VVEAAKPSAAQRKPIHRLNRSAGLIAGPVPSFARLTVH